MQFMSMTTRMFRYYTFIFLTTFFQGLVHGNFRLVIFYTFYRSYRSRKTRSLLFWQICCVASYT